MKKVLFPFLLILLITGCSGSSGLPVIPEIEPVSGSSVETSSTGPWLWGLWDIEYIQDSRDLVVIPDRSADLTWNVTTFLQPPVGIISGLGVSILDATDLLSQGRIDVRVTVHHPFPSKKFRGFDLRGVVMGIGSVTDPYNPDILYPGDNDLRILNPDGYTRWMNAPEFISAGIMGYKPGALGSSNFSPTATLNGFKYFADVITPDIPVWNYFATSLAYVANRGSMVPGSSLSRDYYLQFPTSPLKVKFQYAIIAGWNSPVSGGSNPIPSDFPHDANTYEAIALSVADNSTLFFESDQNKGGDMILTLDILDWWAYWDKNNLDDYFSKIIISSYDVEMPSGDYTELDFSTLTTSPSSAGNGVAVDILIPNCTPSGSDNQEILIAVEMKDFDYSNPFNIPNLAENDPLTGYFFQTLNVSDYYNDPPVLISGINGPSSAFIMDTDIFSVDVADPDTPVLDYSWTIHDPLNGDILKGPFSGDGAGNLEVDWATDGTSGIIELRCDISDGDSVVQAVPKIVDVSDTIFHANLNDTITGDNQGWQNEIDHAGISKWTANVGDDIKLQGFGYKFGYFDTIYLVDSSDILVTPEISIPSGISQAIAVVNHSYDFEYYAPLEVGFDGGNIKVTEAPTLPTFEENETEILGGKDYDGWLFDTAINDQMAFASDQWVKYLLISAFEIPPEYIGSSVYIGFAAATNEFGYGNNHGWLIDDLLIKALPEGGNAPPVAGKPVEGDTLLPLLPQYAGTYDVIGYDIENDPLHYTWTVREPGIGTIIWGPVNDDEEIEIDWSQFVSGGQYEVHVAIYDGSHPGVPAQPLLVTLQDVVFHADFSDTTTGDNAGWSAISQTGATQWTSTVGSDSFLEGFGYKWGEFNLPIQVDSSGILVSPSIAIPPSVSKASIYVNHDFQFIATYDGGNIKVVFAASSPNFGISPENIDAGLDYDTQFVGTVMDGQDCFATGVTGLALSRMDLLNSYYGQNIKIGFAAASGDTFFNMRGWLVDDVTVAVTP